MKPFILVACIALLTFQVSFAEVKITSSGTENLDERQNNVVKGFTEVLSAYIKAKGDLSKLSSILVQKRNKIEENIKLYGPPYFFELADVLSRIYLPDETIANMVAMIRGPTTKETVTTEV